MFLSAKTALVGGLAAAAFAGAVATSATPAQAQVYYSSGYHYGSGYGHPVQYRQYRHGRRDYRRRDNTGAAIAGLVGGLAVGALAAQAAQPRYVQPHYYAPARTYYGGGYYAAPRTCWIERRRLRTNSGRPLYEDRQVCR